MKLLDEKTTYISSEAKIAESAVIYPNNTILGETVIGENTVIMPNCIIDNCKIGNNVKITASVMEGATIADGATVGPFAYLRKGSDVGRECRVGDFVEIKNAKIGDDIRRRLRAGRKVQHRLRRRIRQLRRQEETPHYGRRSLLYRQQLQRHSARGYRGRQLYCGGHDGHGKHARGQPRGRQSASGGKRRTR